MGKKKRSKAPVYPGDVVVAELGLDPGEWSVGVGYRKEFLSGSRWAHVTVTHLPSGKTRSASFPSSGKAAARRDAVAAVRKFVQELRRG
jgi:hypothetical protein